ANRNPIVSTIYFLRLSWCHHLRSPSLWRGNCRTLTCSYRTAYLFLGSLNLGLRLSLCLRSSYLLRILTGQLGLSKEGNNILIKLANKTFEHFKGFKFVDQQRIFLFVNRILNRLLQIIHIS